MTDDRRGLKRIDVPAGLITEDGIWAANLSESGMGLYTRMAFELDATFEITLDLPSGKHDTSVRVVWCQRVCSNSDRDFLVGVEFVALSRATRSAIKAYLTAMVGARAYIAASGIRVDHHISCER